MLTEAESHIHDVNCFLFNFVTYFLIEVRVIGVNLSQGKAKLVRVSQEFELTEFKLTDSK